MENLTLKRVVITGPTGVLGTALTKKMVREGIETYVVCHPGSKRTAAIIEHPLLHKVECDLSEFEKLPSLVGKSCDAFFIWLGWERKILKIGWICIYKTQMCDML